MLLPEHYSSNLSKTNKKKHSSDMHVFVMWHYLLLFALPRNFIVTPCLLTLTMKVAFPSYVLPTTSPFNSKLSSLLFLLQFYSYILNPVIRVALAQKS